QPDERNARGMIVLEFFTNPPLGFTGREHLDGEVGRDLKKRCGEPIGRELVRTNERDVRRAYGSRELYELETGVRKYLAEFAVFDVVDKSLEDGGDDRAVDEVR